MVFYDFKCNLTDQEIVARLPTTFGDESPCKTTTYTWFACGRVNLSDVFRDGRSSTAVNNKNIDTVRRTIETVRHVTYHEIRASLSIVLGELGCWLVFTIASLFYHCVTIAKRRGELDVIRAVKLNSSRF
ncbi:hypothetical protein EVAR_25856_1 [Eumeta japonica]|uniref:Uncharacterized protein n=1 Tax=Eumeta variegata TaxID=151549 RepID=A0A4C1X6J0_EUMVA|nr:hypothetical protein EVAR_25856_1 [Eumeta japonica]